MLESVTRETVHYLLRMDQYVRGFGTTRETEVRRFYTKFHENVTTKMAAGTVCVPSTEECGVYLLMPRVIKAATFDSTGSKF